MIDSLPLFFKILVDISLVSVLISGIFLLFTGIWQHYKIYRIPKFQQKAIITMFLAFLFQILFVGGLIFYKRCPIIEFLIELLISYLIYFFFFKFLVDCISLEAYKIAHDPILSQSYEDILIEKSEMKEIMHEIKDHSLMTLTDFNDKELIEKCLIFIYMKVKVFKPPAFLKCLLKNNICDTISQTKKMIKKNAIYVKFYCIFVPICYFVLMILFITDKEIQLLVQFINICKIICTFICINKMFNLCWNLKKEVKDYKPLMKLFCIKFTVFLFAVQGFILNFIQIDNDTFTHKEMSQIINFFLLCIENCILSMIWVKTYSPQELCISKNNEILSRIQSQKSIVIQETF